MGVFGETAINMEKAAKDFTAALNCACNTDGSEGGVSYQELLDCQSSVDSLFDPAVVEAAHPENISEEDFNKIDQNGDGEINGEEGTMASEIIIAHLKEIGLLEKTAIGKDE